ncbi:MAG: type I-U CRISPR-associated protein Cas5/Cas6 [Deltaproteobacteria bacterium]|nr:type I-U CRISPR-associated protein Cas5/Cas6 [Deltaproteobacteria bacterium]
MIAIELSFPGGHYHATPWGHHVNEGLVEWPPSPWRVLRALVSVGFTKLGWTDIPPVGKEVFSALASSLPSYSVPRATLAHSRHYMPYGNAAQDTTLVIDAWANLGQGAIGVRWPVALPPDSRELLAALVDKLGYLGRAESWVDAKLVEDPGVDPQRVEVMPVDSGSADTMRGFHQVALLAPLQAEQYESWRRTAVASLPEVTAKRAKEKALAAYPPDLLACLTVETRWLREHGWSQPPGSRTALYWRPSDALATIVAPDQRVPKSTERVEAILLAVANPTRNLHALPNLERALPQAELLHQALVSKLRDVWVPEITGTDDQRRPLRGHRHAHILALDLDADRHIDHLLVWAPDGLGAAAQAAVREVRRTYAKRVADLTLAVAGSGSLGAFKSIRDPLGQSLRGLIGPSNIWISRTPFVAPRFLKQRGTNTLEGQVLAELESRGLPTARVELLDDRDDAGGRFRHFVLQRRRGAAPPQLTPFRIRLSFDAELRGPLCLGYASHFGLGSFEVADPR